MDLVRIMPARPEIRVRRPEVPGLVLPAEGLEVARGGPEWSYWARRIREGSVRIQERREAAPRPAAPESEGGGIRRGGRREA